jgi:dTDP-4-dehydrorhamnose reductase
VRVLVTGAGGLLGREVVRQLGERGHEAVACDRRALDITQAARAREIVSRSRPDAVLHCAAFTNVDAAESAPAEAFRVNVDGTEHVARAAAEAGARFMYVSTDYVFDGESSEPYRPDSPVHPLSVYGRSKVGGEQAARLAGDWLVARVSWMYGCGGANFGSRALARARAGQTLHAFTDLRSVPTWVRDAAVNLIRLFERSAPCGMYHANNAGDTTWYHFALEALRLAGVNGVVEPTRAADADLPAARPRYSVMDVSETAAVVGLMRDWKHALSAAVAGGL